MNSKTAKMIRKYAKLRGEGNPLDYDLLKDTYENASPEYQEQFKKEMQQYFKAIDAKTIDPGQSILHSMIPRVTKKGKKKHK